jgi:hypothetical protein
MELGLGLVDWKGQRDSEKVSVIEGQMELSRPVSSFKFSLSSPHSVSMGSGTIGFFSSVATSCRQGALLESWNGRPWQDQRTLSFGSFPRVCNRGISILVQIVLAPVLQMQLIKQHLRKRRERKITALNIKNPYLEGIDSSQLL